MLLVAILTSAADRELQNALVYYLVLEHVRALDTPGRDALDAYTVDTGLPTALRAEMEAYASVDHGDWATAVPLLGDARLFPDVFEMLAAAPLEGKVRAALLLQLFEVRGALPALGDGGTDPARIREYAHVLRAMVQVRGVARAWALCRTLVASLVPAEAALSEPLYTALLDQCFAPPDAAAIEQLLALPLDASEEKHLEAYALAPASAKRAPAALVLDTLLVKLVSQGRYVDAIALDRRTAQHEHTHASVARGRDAADAAHLRIRRKTLLDGIWAVLPAVQRDALQAQDLRELPDPAEDDEPMDEAEAPAPLTQERRVPSAAPAGLEKRVRTPMSSSLSGSTRGSPDACLLRSAVRGPSFSQRAPSPAQPLREEHPVRSSPALRNSSPFAGWQRSAPERRSWASRSTHRAEEPRWGAPGADTSLLAEERQEADLELEPVPEPMEELPLAPAEADRWPAPSEELTAEHAARSEQVADGVEAGPIEEPAAEADGGTHVEERAPEPESEPVGVPDGRSAAAAEPAAAETNTDPTPTQGPRPRSRRGFPRQIKRHVAENAEASSEASTEPSIPGGFPLPGSAPEKAETPRRRRQRSVQDTSTAAPTPPSRGRKAARGTSVEPTAGSLAQLDALHDTTPIARRTRAARAELESLGSQTSTDVGDVSDAGSERAPPTPAGASSTPRTRRRTRASAKAEETPQRNTPRRSRRRGAAH